MTAWNLPGIGGSLGVCVLCGKSFVLNILLGSKVPTIEICGRTCAVHDDCLLVLRELQGKPWQELPPGPLRTAHEEQFAAEDAGKEAT